ncbi:pyridoxamine 5'-phosphate oxidase-domain-containing protein [Xylaria bambusicola]|uniref:pyridoxamine 5'-phosphate oxidase-domain-containing protein n=1 Tax=Xylaria bambusicola TaxID=326684 RepID=UPI0020079F07|nr:pyridoxamine 5'-phosphate oxidase-domain-containing protein [Xylaria bambusicola]KAI0516739.1 pyridoxamine 5'-phosphate oxidase-domain-containing protein [Xylaria bambusicola]
MRRATNILCLASHLQPHRIQSISTATTTTPSPPTIGKMSASPPPSAAAPWRSLFLSHLEGMDSAEFTLSTLRRASSSSSSSSSAGGRRSSILAAPLYVPRARTCICRGLWAHLPINPKNEAELNPEGVWESELITFTTDVRMDKMEELWENGLDFDLRTGGRRGTDPGSPTTGKVGEELWEDSLARMKGKRSSSDENAAKSSKERKLKGSGGGGTVEAVFWAREPGVQWRVRGRAYVLAPDIETSPEGREVVSALKSRMRKQSQSQSEEESQWSFAREITAHFGNLSPAMRGTFRNPPPGRPVHLPVEDKGLGLGQKVADLEDAVARANFRVVVIVPEELDQADLSDPENPKRWIHTYVGAGDKGKGGWETVEVWP